MVKGVRRHLAMMLFASVLSVLGACDGAGVWTQAGASFIQFSSSSISAGTLRLRGGAAATLGEVTAVGTKQAFDLMLQEAGDKLVVVDFTAQCKHARPKTNAHLRRTLAGAARTQPACVLPGLLCRVWAVPADSADRGVHGDRGGPCSLSPSLALSPLHFDPS